MMGGSGSRFRRDFRRMSALFTKDPESGIYRSIETPRPRSVFTVLLPALVGIVALGAMTKTAGHKMEFARVPVTTIHRQGFDATVAPVSLKGAMELYKVRGGHYIVGHNDCSSFVLDYLAGHGIKLADRQTTATLVDTQVAGKMHLIPMDEMEITRPIDQSVVVLRYQGKSGERVGHCAVRIFQNGNAYFIHNTESGGLVVDDPESFYRRFDHSKVRDVRYYRFEGGF